MVNLEDLKFVTCPRCKGEGIHSDNKVCGECGGVALGVFISDKFIYFNQDFKSSIIQIHSGQEFLSKIFSAALYFFGFGGVIALWYWFYQTSSTASNIKDFYFWEAKNSFILMFWAGILSLMYEYYRHSLDHDKHKIKILSANRGKHVPENWRELRTSSGKFKVNAAKYLSAHALHSLESAALLAAKRKHNYITPLHFWHVVLNDKIVEKFLQRIEIDITKLRTLIDKRLQLEPTISNKSNVPVLHTTLLKTLVSAFYVKRDNVGESIELIDIFAWGGFYCEGVQSILANFDLLEEDLVRAHQWLLFDREASDKAVRAKKLAQFKQSKGFWRFYNIIATPILDHFTYDLSRDAKLEKLEHCLGREKELLEFFNIIKVKGNVVLTGERGIGKSALVSKIIEAIVGNKAFAEINKKRVVKINMAKIAENVDVATIKEHFLVLLDEARRAGNVVVYLENLNDLYIGGAELADDLAHTLAGHLKRKSFYFISCSNLSLNKSVVEEIPSVLKDFINIFKVNPLNFEQTLDVLSLNVGYSEARNNVYFTLQVLKSVARLAMKYAKNKTTPGCALDILRLVAEKYNKPGVTRQKIYTKDVLSIVGEISGANITKIETEEIMLNVINDLKRKMSGDVFGQVKMLDDLVAGLKKSVSGKESSGFYSALFLGQKGCGKKAVLRSLAKHYCCSENNLIVIDLKESKSQEEHFVSAAQKVFGNEQNFIIYLQSLDLAEQSLKDRLADFLSADKTGYYSNLILIASISGSNDNLRDRILIGEKKEGLLSAAVKFANSKLGDSLVAAFKNILIFSPLKLEDGIELTRARFKRIKNVLEAEGIAFRFKDDAVDFLVKENFNPVVGAVELSARLSEIEENIANLVIDGKISTGGIVSLNAKGEIE